MCRSHSLGYGRMANRGCPEPVRLAANGRDGNSGVEREHAGLVGEQRIDVEFTDLRQVCRQLCELHERERDLVVLCRRHVPIGAQDA